MPIFYHAYLRYLDGLLVQQAQLPQGLPANARTISKQRGRAAAGIEHPRRKLDLELTAVV